MVNQKVNVKDKHRKSKKFLKIIIIIAVIAAILAAAFFSGFLTKPKQVVKLENPLKDIVLANTNVKGQVDQKAVIEQGVIEFNEQYINYLLIALGVGKLHKSYIGYGNPKLELVMDEETWSSEIDGGRLGTTNNPIVEEDLKISLSKEEAVTALLSPNIEQFMKDSVSNGNTNIELVANKVELGSKGYLAMYTDLTGEEIEVEE